VAASGWRASYFRSKSAPAFVASIALHVAVGYAVLRVQWAAPDVRRPATTNVVWLGEWRPVPPDLPAPETSTRAEPPTQSPETESTEIAEPPAVTAPEAQSEPAPEPARESPAPRIDWDEARRRAITQALEQFAREERYRRFSDDRLSEEEVAEPPNPRARMFDSPATAGDRRPWLTPGRSRTHFGHWLAETCNALTGGISFFGLASACADAPPWADFFADVRPAYLEKLPLCEETPEEQLSPLAIERRDEFSTVKCRLVAKE
jgi:hypothetical protein